MTDDLVPGEVRAGDGPLILNKGRETATVDVANTGDRPVQVGSHFHFFEANAALAFDREAALGMRLNVPAGTAVRFEPGDTKSVDLVAIGGERRARGMNGLVDGTVTGDSAAAARRAREEGFGFNASADGEPNAESTGEEDAE